MSGLDGLQLDPDGFIDMDQFPDDGTDLAGPDLDQLREALHSDPVDEPTPEEWDAMFDEVVTTDDTGPFALDDVEGLTGDGGAEAFGSSAPESDDVLDADGDGIPDADDLPDVDDGLPDDLAVDAVDDLDLDTTDYDGGLDLSADDGVDDVYAPDALDDAPAEVANNDFEDLL